MNKKLFVIVNCLLFWLLVSPVIAQNDYWAAVRQDFNNRKGVSQFESDRIGAYELKSDNLSRDMAQYLTFLYAYMPQSDLADYDFKFFE